MTLLDLAIIAVCAFNIIQGFRKGFIKILLDFLGIFLSTTIAIKSTSTIGTFVSAHTSLDSPYNKVAAFLFCWISIMTVVNLVNKLITRSFSVTGLGFYNRIMGLAIGGVKSIVIIIPIILPLLFFKPHLIQESVVLKPGLPYIELLKDVILGKASKLSASITEKAHFE